MIEIQDISLVEYHELDEDTKREYDFAIKYGKQFNTPINVFEAPDFTELSFGIVKDMQQDFQGEISWKTILDYTEKITGLSKKDIAKRKLLTVCRFNAHILAEVERINEIESQLLSSAPTAEEVAAGIDQFAKFGAYPQLRKLAKGDLTKLEEIKELPYHLCLLELHYDKTYNEFRNQVIKLRKPKK